MPAPCEFEPMKVPFVPCFSDFVTNKCKYCKCQIFHYWLNTTFIFKKTNFQGNYSLITVISFLNGDLMGIDFEVVTTPPCTGRKFNRYEIAVMIALLAWREKQSGFSVAELTAELLQEFGADSLFSLCAADYDEAVRWLVEGGLTKFTAASTTG